MYDTLRFVCVTGNVIGEKKPLADFTDKIADVNLRYMGEGRALTPAPRRKATVTDSALIDRILKSRQGEKACIGTEKK